MYSAAVKRVRVRDTRMPLFAEPFISWQKAGTRMQFSTMIAETYLIKKLAPARPIWVTMLLHITMHTSAEVLEANVYGSLSAKPHVYRRRKIERERERDEHKHV
jgi:hypothetical protein